MRPIIMRYRTRVATSRSTMPCVGNSLTTYRQRPTSMRRRGVGVVALRGSRAGVVMLMSATIGIFRRKRAWNLMDQAGKQHHNNSRLVFHYHPGFSFLPHITCRGKRKVPVLLTLRVHFYKKYICINPLKGNLACDHGDRPHQVLD